MRFAVLLLAPLCFAHTPLERLETAHLEATHAQRLEWMKKRAPTVPPLGVYQDFRAIFHLHSEDAGLQTPPAISIHGGQADRRAGMHPNGIRPEVLEAAKAAGVNVILFTDPRGPRIETWSGLHDGVLFIPGSEDDHALRYPSPTRALKFLSHLEERPDMPSEGFQGQEIYDGHTDAAIHKEVHDYIRDAMKKPAQRKQLVANLKAYPDEVFAAGTDALPQFLQQWDRETAEHPFTGIAANHSLQNTFNGVTFDPYAVAFRFVSTHILARDLTEPDIRASLAAGRAYVAHDWLCDPTGFTFFAENNLGLFDIGDQVPLLNNTRLQARLPIAAKIKLIHLNAIVAETNDSKFSFTVKEPGAYRLEAWLTVDHEDRPWIYSNPIYIVRPVSPSIPTIAFSPNVDIRRDILYTGEEPTVGRTPGSAQVLQDPLTANESTVGRTSGSARVLQDPLTANESTVGRTSRSARVLQDPLTANESTVGRTSRSARVLQDPLTANESTVGRTSGSARVLPDPPCTTCNDGSATTGSAPPDPDPADAAKHKLDLYLPKDKKNFPVMVFYHGGSWHSGDRAQYAALGERFAQAGIGVAIPSYRLMPNAPHPAQIEDAAAAFAWVCKNIDSYGGDVSRIYIVGHSAGGHLAALLALDPQYLKKFDIPVTAIHGVAALSGIYDVSRTGVFGDFGLDASPMQHLHPHAPPFLVTYCQWDYQGLPKQARDFAAALKTRFVSTKLVYVPGESHISEIIDVIKDGDPTALALLDFIK